MRNSEKWGLSYDFGSVGEETESGGEGSELELQTVVIGDRVFYEVPVGCLTDEERHGRVDYKDRRRTMCEKKTAKVLVEVEVAVSELDGLIRKIATGVDPEPADIAVQHLKNVQKVVGYQQMAAAIMAGEEEDGSYQTTVKILGKAEVQNRLNELEGALELARSEITNMEQNMKEGKPGFCCDVIDQIDSALNNEEDDDD